MRHGGITRPCVKHNFLVKDVKTSRSRSRRRSILAKSGRPGPVLVDISQGRYLGQVPVPVPETVTMRSYNPVVKGHPGQIKKAVQLLTEANRPIV